MSALPRAPLAFIGHYLRTGFFWHAIGVALLIAVSTALDTAQPYFLGKLVGSLAAPGEGDSRIWFAAMCGAWLFGYLLTHAYGTFASFTIMSMRARIHDELFDYLHGHAPRYFLDHASGALVQKVRHAAGSAGIMFDYICFNVIRLGVMFAVTLLMILRQAPQLLWAFVLFLVVFTVSAVVLAQRLRRHAKASAKASADQVARMVDSISNWDVVKSFARGAFELLTLKPFTQMELDAVIRLRLAATGMRVTLSFLSVVFLAWLVWQALLSARAGAIDIGTFTAVVSLSVLVAANVRTLGDNLFVFFEHYGVLSDSLSTLLEPHEITDSPGAPPLRVAGGEILFDRMAFQYADGTPVFEAFDLRIRSGERVGLVGPSGAGKSTLIKLLRRQFTLNAGRILIDGQNVEDVTWESLHDAIAEVPQNPSMFHRTVRDNIRYSRPEASDDEVITAARLAHCHEFIVGRASGYDSVVGEKGMKLSGGERQRVSMARAFLKNAPILVLDEATSSLDSEAEHLIQDGLLKLMEGRTVIAIAHRLSTIMHLDRIVVLDEGRIVEEGAHEELRSAGGVYARLWARQAGGFI